MDICRVTGTQVEVNGGEVRLELRLNALQSSPRGGVARVVQKDTFVGTERLAQQTLAFGQSGIAQVECRIGRIAEDLPKYPAEFRIDFTRRARASRSTPTTTRAAPTKRRTGRFFLFLSARQSPCSNLSASPSLTVMPIPNGCPDPE